MSRMDWFSERGSVMLMALDEVFMCPGAMFTAEKVAYLDVQLAMYEMNVEAGQ